MEYKALSLEEEMKIVVNDKLRKIDGDRMIGVDADGNAALVFKLEGMYPGFMSYDVLQRKAKACLPCRQASD